jgi:hypothetical protein
MYFFLFFVISFPFLVTRATKKNEKNHRGSDNDSASKEDEDSDESSGKELDKKVKLKNTTQAKGKPERLYF